MGEEIAQVFVDIEYGDEAYDFEFRIYESYAGRVQVIGDSLRVANGKNPWILPFELQVMAIALDELEGQ